MRGLLVALMLLWAPAIGLAQEKPEDEETALSLARAAFEFRDFEKVVAVLRPWVRPMRIRTEERKIEARALMGISLHLLGRVDEAKEEFGDLLLLDPKHELDPFVVPPEVIATFESVRRELRPTLDQILRERGEKPPPEAPPVELKLVTVPHPVTIWLPFGVPQFVMEEPGWGAAFALVQALGVAGNIAAYFAGNAARNQERADRMEGIPAQGTQPSDRWLVVQYTALAAALVAYAGSVIHGYYLLDRLEGRLAAPEPGTAPAIR